MGEPSSSEYEAIKAQPIGHGLDDFCNSFRSKYLETENEDATIAADRLLRDASTSR
jgi:hypothetical protein